MNESQGKLLELLEEMDERDKDDLYELLKHLALGDSYRESAMDAAGLVRGLLFQVGRACGRDNLSAEQALLELEAMRGRSKRISAVLMRICGTMKESLDGTDQNFDKFVDMLESKFPEADPAPSFTMPEAGEVWRVGTRDTMTDLKVESVGDTGAYCRTDSTTAEPHFVPFPFFYGAQLVSGSKQRMRKLRR